MLLGKVLILCGFISTSLALYKVGVGISDVTGPPAEITFMGYADLPQKGTGIHLRQFSRAFVFEDDSNILAIAVVEIQSVGTGLRREIIKNLQDRYGEAYNDNNVILTTTHTHSGPGGYLMDMLYDISILGFVGETFDAIVDGVVKSIIIAHDSKRPARIFYSETEVSGASINRSPTSYLKNPEVERKLYKDDTDKQLSQIKIVEETTNKVFGTLHWFSIHATNMNMSNTLVSSDNLGYASQLLEKQNNLPGTLPGKGSFIGAFAITNHGDISPNTRGPHCEISDLPCDNEESRCENLDEKCIATGPGRDMFESTKIIGTKLFNGAQYLLSETGEEISGSIQSIHQFVDFPNEIVSPYDVEEDRFRVEEKVGGCLPAMGYSFAAGTIDGPGAFNFSQGTTSDNPLWNMVSGILARPTSEDVACHSPKPILLMTGRVSFPYSWQPTIVSTQLAKIGQIVIAPVSGEFTTMAGRRLKRIITKTLYKDIPNIKVLVTGLSNLYTSYVVTREEYEVQRYEAASTMYGPHTLDIYINKYVELANALIASKTLDAGPTPADFKNRLLSLVTPVAYDGTPLRRQFGDCVQEPQASYKSGQTAAAIFISGHPRNNLQHGNWYAAVERLEGNSWITVATDADWETKFYWRRTSTILGTSEVEFQWEITSNVSPGVYRIHHYGHSRSIIGRITPYEGISREFQITN